MAEQRKELRAETAPDEGSPLEKEAAARKEKDLHAWQQWNKSRNDADLMMVMDRINPVIMGEVNRWSGAVAPPTLTLEAKNLALGAIKTFDPNRGAALNTHVTNKLKKLSRLVYSNQNLARIPEHKTLQQRTFAMAEERLRDRLGRDPTADELREELGWTRNYLADFQRSARKEFVDTGEVANVFDTDSGDTGLVDFAYQDLSPLQKKIFEYRTGYGGKPVLSNPEIRKKLGLRQSQLSYQHRKMVDRLHRVLNAGATE